MRGQPARRWRRTTGSARHTGNADRRPSTRRSALRASPVEAPITLRDQHGLLSGHGATYLIAAWADDESGSPLSIWSQSSSALGRA
jgi:hypothetical protein